MRIREIKQKIEKMHSQDGKAENKDGVIVFGWLKQIKDLGKIKFLRLRDDTGEIQVTVVKEDYDKLENQGFDKVKFAKESVLFIRGKVKEGKEDYEIIPENIELISGSDSVLPISFKDQANLSKRLDWRCLDLRSKKLQSIMRIQSSIIQSASQHLFKKGFMQVFTPCIMGVASESGSEVFPLIYFDKEAFLRQDPQLHRQLTIAGGFSSIFDIGPAWRAENSHTTKHLCEHRVIAVESAFIKDEYDTMKIEEGIIRSVVEHLNEKCKEDLELHDVELALPREGFPVLKFPEIYEILKQKGKKIDYGEDLDSDSEKILCDYVKEKFGSDFYFINRFPFSKKPFYVMKNDDEWARSVDLYYKGIELSSGGQREHRYDELMKNVKSKGMKDSDVEWFTKFFKYGVPPHGGFAIGIERLTQSLLGVDNIRDCVLFPRDTERLVP
jgi:aspartyl-tRNA synthetase